MSQTSPSGPQPVTMLPIVAVTSLTERREKCAWCWARRYPGVPYPEEWSSTLCLECHARILAESACRKAARAAARAKSGEASE